MPEVFLSHSSRDHKAAEHLRKVLLAHGIQVWFSPHHIQGAQQWQDEIGAALARCGWFLLFLTPNAVKSMWVKRELNYALEETRYQNRIVPVIFRKCDSHALSWTLKALQSIDFTKDFWRGCEQLLRLWRKRLDDDVKRRLKPPRLPRA